MTGLSIYPTEQDGHVGAAVTAATTAGIASATKVMLRDTKRRSDSRSIWVFPSKQEWAVYMQFGQPGAAASAATMAWIARMASMLARETWRWGESREST